MIAIDNIGTLATLIANPSSSIGEIDNAAVLIDDQTIFWCGKSKDQPKVKIEQTIDAGGHLVLPGLVDCHTHLLFVGSRQNEFALRMHNETYQSIMEKGGGIWSTVKATAQASDETLWHLALNRADKILAQGVTTLEAKSGYGLNSQSELRLLSLLKKLDETHALDIHATFLGAHIVPKDFIHQRDKYVDLIIEEMLEQVASLKLAIDCDVFCDNGAFTPEEALRILSRAQALGFGLRAHVQQLSLNGGVSLVRELPLKSISHADFLSERDIEILAQSKTIVEVLPIAALFLRSKHFTNVKALTEASVNLAIATDFNPGSAMCHDLVLAARLGVTYGGFTVPDALRAITINAGRSLGRYDLGVIEPNGPADVLITNCESVNEFFYDWTKHPSKAVIKKGKLI